MTPWGRRRRPQADPVLRVDPVACDGVGICAHLAPDVITVDTWGYPIIAPLEGRSAVRQAKAAVAACPRRALFLAEAPAPPAPASAPGAAPSARRGP